MDPIEGYLQEVRDIHSSGAAVAETSYYPALSNLFNELGKNLKPRVRCIVTPANRGAGIPDIGLYTADQFKRKANAELPDGQMPSRGVLEAKPPSKEVAEIAATEQVRKYCLKYGTVIVTNLREFLLVSRGEDSEPATLESFRIAADEGSFWSCTVHHSKTAKEIAPGLQEFLTRVMLLNAPLYEPKDLAWFLASYARDAKIAVEQASIPALDEVRLALEEVLGMEFTGQKGEHFFRSTLVQTIFYGVFSAWVLWCRSGIPEKQISSFDWRQAQWLINVPFIRTLFENLMMPGKLKPLGLVEILDRASSVLNRVDRGAFFAKFREEHAVQYFYEPFLEAFDPELRKDLGVWYTPREIVQYQVARVDEVLRKEMALADGLADPSVLVLDPCCGTGTYLIEVLNRIATTLRGKGGGALVAAEVKKAAMTKVFGFEILPAPFVVSHLQLGLLLQRMGAGLNNATGERAAVFLTNSLTGWEPHKESKPIPFPELVQEHVEAEKVKQSSRILVILGNPPYNAFAGVSPKEELGLVEPYKRKLNLPVSEDGWGIKKFNLDDLYVRFFRLAERRIAEMTGKGIVSFISNHSWIAEPSFVVLRKHLLENFDKFWIENLHGNRKISEYAPDGRTSETIFAVQGFSVGIQQGVATSLWVRRGGTRNEPTVLFRDDINAAKAEERRAQLLSTLENDDFDSAYTVSKPSAENRYSFRPENVSVEYLRWPRLNELCEAAPSNGLMEKRGGALISIDRESLENRMRDYLDPTLSWEEYRARHRGLTDQQAGFEPEEVRKKALASKETFMLARIQRYSVRPFEMRWCYYTKLNPIWNRARPALWDQTFSGNAFVLSRTKPGKDPEGAPLYFCKVLSDDHLLSPDASCFPFWLAPKGYKDDSERQQGKTVHIPLKANLSEASRRYLEKIGVGGFDTEISQASLIWLHSLAVGYSHVYITDNIDGLKSDWPRIPLPSTGKLLMESARLGQSVAELLDTENEVAGVTEDDMEPVFRLTATVQRVGGGQLDPNTGHLDLTAGWGHEGKDGVTMPGKGVIHARPFSPEEKAAIAEAAEKRGITVREAMKRIGPDTRDVFLNDHAFWKNIPVAAWEFYIGGYQVIKKWLSYRQRDLLGRSMSVAEVAEVTNMARRLTALRLLTPALDTNYLHVKRSAYPWG